MSQHMICKELDLYLSKLRKRGYRFPKTFNHDLLKLHNRWLGKPNENSIKGILNDRLPNKLSYIGDDSVYRQGLIDSLPKMILELYPTQTKKQCRH